MGRAVLLLTLVQLPLVSIKLVRQRVHFRFQRLQVLQLAGNLTCKHSSIMQGVGGCEWPSGGQQRRRRQQQQHHAGRGDGVDSGTTAPECSGSVQTCILVYEHPNYYHRLRLTLVASAPASRQAIRQAASSAKDILLCEPGMAPRYRWQGTCRVMDGCTNASKSVSMCV
jgi:hypothetical protein